MTWTLRSSWANTKNVENWTLQIGQCSANVYWNSHCVKTSQKCNCLSNFTISVYRPIYSQSSLILRYKREDFEKLAQLIVSVFPTENPDTYFIPAQYGKPAKGKLWDSYNHIRSVLAAVGFIERRPRKCRPPEESSELLGIWGVSVGIMMAISASDTMQSLVAV